MTETNVRKTTAQEAGYVWANEASMAFLERDYLAPGQTLDERVDVICDTAERLLGKPGFAARFKANLKKGWYSLASPIWTNFGTDRGLPISCFGSYVEDSCHSILQTHLEIGMMSKLGGGTSAYFGDVRHRGAPIQGGVNGTSNGAVSFMATYDMLIQVFSQGSSRRGQCAVYLPIDHGDIDEFLTIKSDGSPIQQLSFGVCISDAWMEAMIGGDKAKRKVWAKVLTARANTGYPYLFFTDNANNGAPAPYGAKHGRPIWHSNLCTEIMQPDNALEAFVCDLSSYNVRYYNAWKDHPTAVEDLIRFLDAVMTEFIAKAKLIPGMERAVRYAENHRALGAGWLGWHSLLQSESIPFESLAAKSLNAEVARHIHARSNAASRQLAAEFGEPAALVGTGRRNGFLSAIAPTKSSSFIIEQTSEGIEPERGNIVVKDTQKGKYTVRNKFLEPVLEKYGKNTATIWKSIQKHAGSVQHLDFLTQHERDVFKTFAEIGPAEIVLQAAIRQKWIDQGQSLNLIIDPKVPPKDVSELYISGWRQGIKSFYYQISVNAAQQLSRSINQCVSCEA